MTNPNTLLKLAEAQGYTVNPVTECGITVDCNGHWIDYNPEQNAEQLMELIEHYKMDLLYNEPNKQWEVEIPNTSTETTPDIFVHADTLVEAVLRAALKCIGET